MRRDLALALGLMLGGCGGQGQMAAQPRGDASLALDATSSAEGSTDASVESGPLPSADSGVPPGASGDAAASAIDGGADAANDAVGWVFPRPVCGGYDSGVCGGAQAAILSSPQITGPDGGPFSFGQDAIVSVLLSAPAQSIQYPCVGFAADNPGVTFSGSDPQFIGIYSLNQGLSGRVAITVHFASSIPHGTVVQFAAWVDSLNSACSDGAQLRWDVTVP